MNKVVVSHNPNNGMTKISWMEMGRKRTKSLFDETSISNFISRLKPDEVMYKKHNRENVSKSFGVTNTVVVKAKEVVATAKQQGDCLVHSSKYKRIWCVDRLIPANRLVFFANNPIVSQTNSVTMTCGNPYCVKPEHLCIASGYSGVEKELFYKAVKQTTTPVVDRELVEIEGVEKEIKAEVANNPSLVRNAYARRRIEEIKDNLFIKKEYDYC